MNLLCPNCQKQLSVPEQNAGQLMKCPFCSKYFSVPALPQALDVDAGVTRSSVAVSPSPLPTAPAPPPAQASGFPTSREVTVSEPALARSNESSGVYPSAVPSPAVGQPPPPPPTGYEHAATFGINRRVVSWLTPVALLLVLILMYFPWTGVYPGGYAVYTQNALQMIWGGFSVDATGDKVLGMAKGIEGAMNANWMMAIYLLFLLAALFLGVLPLVQAHTPYPLPQSLQKILPWRTLLVLILTLLAFLILLRFLVGGSGFENAVITVALKSPEKEPATPTLEEQIERGLQISRLNLSRTFWLGCAVLFHIIALVGSGMELGLQRRGERPLPRMEVHW